MQTEVTGPKKQRISGGQLRVCLADQKLTLHGKTRRKRIGMKRKLSIAFAVIAFVIILGILYLVLPHADHSLATRGVAIVDSFYSSDSDFTDTAVAFLSSEDINVDVYRDENVTVELFRELPTCGYSLIVLRVHAGLGEDITSPTFLFTNEPYTDNKYPMERASKQILQGIFDLSNPVNPVFSVGPLFIDRSMRGNFNNSIIILSSCYGLHNEWLPDAFIKRGAKAFIGWNEKVSLEHADEASLVLLKAFVSENMTISNATAKVMDQVGSDEAYDSKLLYYPNDSGHLKLSPVS